MADKMKRNQFTLFLEKNKFAKASDIKFCQYLANILIIMLKMNCVRNNILVLEKCLCWQYFFLNY